MKVLVLNSGSSSLKFALCDTSTEECPVRGQVDALGQDHAALKFQAGQDIYEKKVPGADHIKALEEILEYFQAQNIDSDDFEAIGHRIVHGGEKFVEATVIDDEVIGAIKDCINLAPLHNPANLMGVEVGRKVFPEKPQVAVFDTAFHQTIPPIAYRYSLPTYLYESHGVRKYGFHGTSHRYVVNQAAKMLNKPLSRCCFISAHLGNGCSATAVKYGNSVDTTMGLTPLDGLVMGTRSGNVDPGLHEYLTRIMGWNIHQINDVLNKKSGLLGISGLSSDMREITTAAKNGHLGAKLAAEVFSYHLAQSIASLSINFTHLDALVLTGGIGEHSTTVRAMAIPLLQILGFSLDVLRNEVDGKHTRGVITIEGWSPMAIIVKTNEELQIALDVEALLGSK
ncbi:acetate kinase [bacterium]|jgi:acetate kinase|nr:acetate kinase [bacterium]